MSIVILQGPRWATPRPAIRDLSGLWRKARAAGHVLDFRMSESVAAFIGSIRCATSGNCAFVLLDPGALQEHHLRETCDALETLPMPYIEVHDRSADVLDRPLSRYPRRWPPS